jgi:hypothetical protein
MLSAAEIIKFPVYSSSLISRADLLSTIINNLKEPPQSFMVECRWPLLFDDGELMTPICPRARQLCQYHVDLLPFDYDYDVCFLRTHFYRADFECDIFCSLLVATSRFEVHAMKDPFNHEY